MTNSNDKLTQLADVCKSTLSLDSFKAIGAVILAILSFFFDRVNVAAILSLFVLTVFDFVMAWIAVRATPGEEMKSSKGVRTPMKWVVYFMLISGGFLSETSLEPLNIPFSKAFDETIIGALAMSELHSIVENAGKAGYTQARKLLDLISKVKKYES
jgi:phage-related holin